MPGSTDEKSNTYTTVIFLVITLVIGIICLISGIENVNSKPIPINKNGDTTYEYNPQILGLISLIIAGLILILFITLGALWIYDK